jgi:hypothetical protein
MEQKENIYKKSLNVHGEPNSPTEKFSRKLKKRAEELPFSAHPYHEVLSARNEQGFESWEAAGDEHKNQATAALGGWAFDVFAASAAETLSDILRLASAANRIGKTFTETYDAHFNTGVSDDDDDDEQEMHPGLILERAADEVMSDMSWIRDAVQHFVNNAVDYEQVGQELFAHGCKLEAAIAKETAAAEAAKAKVMRAQHPTTN